MIPPHGALMAACIHMVPDSPPSSRVACPECMILHLIEPINIMDKKTNWIVLCTEECAKKELEHIPFANKLIPFVKQPQMN